jgi:hypothetical protein
MLRTIDRRQIVLVGLLAAWLGVWGAWIPSVSASLSQNVFMLAEWSTFLPGVRSGEIRLAPDALRLGAALGVCALVFATEFIPSKWIRWVVRIGTAVPVFIVLLPPYPDLLQMWGSPSYGARFGTASVVIAGLAASVFISKLPPVALRWVIVATGILAIAFAIFGLAALIPPFQAAYSSTVGAGWGLSAFFAGILISIVAGVQLAAAPLAPAGKK